MSKPYKEIAPISPENREAIRRKTAYSLPDEPSARGMPPDQIRKHFWSALTGDRQSLFVEIDRVAKETNAAIDALLMLIFGTVEVDGEAVRIAELIPTGISDYSLADLLAGFVDGSAQQLISSGVGDMSMAEYLALLDQKIEEGGGGGIDEETDPTVPAWAKKPSKPTYTASEVGARPDTWMPTYTDVGADKSGAAASAVSGHNTSTAAHSDLRQLITALTNRLNALANSSDTDLDQLSEIVAYIKANKSLIDSITTSKVSVADIVNNLTTNATNKPLSAAQGVALKALIDAITVPTKVSQLENDAKYLTGFTESDPTVPAWAKEKTKPSYNKSEVGLGNVDNVKQYSASNPPPYPVASVNGKTGALTLDAADVGAHPNTWMPSAADVGARPNTWMPTYTDVGADKSGAAASAVSEHNVNTDAHNDIRLLLQGLADRMNAIANSDDTTLDDFKEVVAYIKTNKSLIDAITTNKINYTDIINNLTTNVTNKPLSAAQGVALKALIDAITVPTKTSQLTNDSNFAVTTNAQTWTFELEDGTIVTKKVVLAP